MPLKCGECAVGGKQYEISITIFGPLLETFIPNFIKIERAVLEKMSVRTDPCALAKWTWYDLRRASYGHVWAW